MAGTRWDKRIDQLRRDNRSGAEEIAARALELLTDVVFEPAPRNPLAYRDWLLRISREVVAAQPSMGVLFRLANDMLWACDAGMEGEEIRQDALAFLQGYRAHAGVALDELARRAVEWLVDCPVIMTYSRSSTVLRVLTAMAERDVHVRVICGEGRPMLEGQTLASELSWVGLNVTVGIDMALFGWLPEASVLVLGADSLSVSGVVNKIGSAELVRAALKLGIPRVVLCTTHKFLPADYLVAQKLRVGDPGEIMPMSDEGITVRNEYFDVTPLESISTVIMEKGPLGPDQIGEELAKIRAYPGL